MGGGLRLTLRRLFSLRGRISRREYLVTGVGLMFFKYAVDTISIYLVAHVVWTPLNYFFPLIGERVSKVGTFPTWFQLALLIWTLPFMWIGVTMTMRRAIDAGKSAAWCAAFFIPFVNYAVMLWLAAVPSSEEMLEDEGVDRTTTADRYRNAIFGALGAVACALAAILVSVYGFGSYGGPLFLGTPFIQGLVCGWSFNRDRIRTDGETNGVVFLSLLIVAGIVFLFAMEGIVCLLMALPLAVVLALMGGCRGQIDCAPPGVGDGVRRPSLRGARGLLRSARVGCACADL